MLAERAATWPKEWIGEGYEKGWKEGYEKGWREGYEKGWLDGQRVALSILAEAKFSALEARHQTAIAEASEEQLKQWFEGILTAGDPDDLFHG